jgi:enoyl-CoA hydratase/carnithine racemase
VAVAVIRSAGERFFSAGADRKGYLEEELASLFASEDAREGLTASIEQRAPRYSGS